MPASHKMLELIALSKSFDGLTPVLQGVNLTVDAGEIVCLLGPSGCGKTTLLRIIAGLETFDQGQLLLNGQDLTRVPVHLRAFGFMFQEFALFPHKSVGENIAFGLRMVGQTTKAIAARVADMLELVDLAGYEKRSIFELSGGERQRVALARSLAPSPRLLMLDEPLGSLDRGLREELMNELRMILKHVGVTALYVTHDQEEAYAVADRLVVMHRGQIKQVGTPAQVYRQPISEFVARFLGFSNLVPATVTAEAPHLAQTPIGSFTLTDAAQPGIQTLLIRPDAARLITKSKAQDHRAPNRISGTLAALSFRGSHYRTTVTVAGADQAHTLHFTLSTDELVPSACDLSIGDPIELATDARYGLTLLER